MLKPQKIKFNKKDLKKDPLLDSVLKAQTFYEKNKNALTYTVVGILAIILLSMWGIGIYHETQDEATTLLGKAQVEYDELNFTKARNFLTQLRQEYSGTDAEEQGTFLLANLYFTENNIAEAKNLFKEFISSYSGSEILLASGYAGLAACLEAEKDYQVAAVKYEKAYKTAKEFPQAAEYLYLAGVNYLSSGDTENANRSLKQVIEEYPDSPKKYDAQVKLIQLAAK
jgi:TolA-binding protein